MTEHDWPAIILPVAESFWGEPNKKLSTDKEKKWGSYGARTVNLEKACWFDHEAGEGGNVIELVQREQGLGEDKAAAMAWLEQEGLISLSQERQERREQRTTPQPRQEPKQPPATSSEDNGGELTWVAGYTYHDADGNPLYQVLRGQWRLPDGSWRLAKDGQIAKTFRQRRKGTDGQVIWNLNGIGHTIYRHQQVELAIEAGKTILLPEGEKDADTAVALGFEASTNSGGAKNWTPELARLFKDADVVIPVDNDDTGIAAGEAKAKSLKGIARRIRVFNFADHVPGFPAKHDLTNWVEAGGTAEELQRIIDKLPDWRPRKPQGFGGRAFADIADKPIEYDWLIKNLVERNGVVILAGEKQAGKTFAALDMGMKVARGLPYGGKKTRQGVVIHIAIEDGRGVRMRAEGYRRFNEISPDQDIPYIIMDREFSLMSDDSVDKLIAEARAWAEYYDMPVELIIIDTWSVATEGLNEIDGAEVGKVLARINRLKDETRATICLVHHMNASGSRVRGHTSIEANVSNVIEIKAAMTVPDNRRDQPRPILDAKGRHVRHVTLTKNKNGLNNVKWRLSLEVVHLGIDSDGDPITTCVCVPVARNEAQAPKERRSLSPDQRLVYDALLAALEDRGTVIPQGVRAGPQVRRAVSQSDFVAYVRKQISFTAPEDEVEARNKELGAFLKRTTISLINAGYMGRDNDKKVVWSLGRQIEEPASPPDDAEPPPSIPDDVKSEMEGLPDEPPF